MNSKQKHDTNEEEYIKYKPSVKRYYKKIKKNNELSIIGNVTEATKTFEEIFSMTEEEQYTVFLCGPEIYKKNSTPSGKLREKLLNALEKENFEVVLGEHKDLENVRSKYGLNAQDNELNFIIAECHAIIIIPNSPGSFCELGLFSWHYANDAGQIREANKKFNKNSKRDIEILILVDEQFKRKRSYLKEGPFKSLRGLGDIDYVNYNNYKTHDDDIERIKDILINQRCEKIKATKKAIIKATKKATKKAIIKATKKATKKAIIKTTIKAIKKATIKVIKNA